VAGPVLGIDFLGKLKVIVSPEISWRFSHNHVDLVGPLQYSNSFNYIFTIIDCMSKWMEAIPLSETSAVACAKALTFTWISRFGVPEMITSDRGPQFTSNLLFHLCEMLNISHKQTIAYHPESNGAVESLHRCLKDALRIRAAAATWSEELPFVLLGPRAQLREDTGLSPAEAVFGAQIVLPNEFLQNDKLSVDIIVKKFAKTLHVSAPSVPRHNSSTKLPSELPAELLSAPPYLGPSRRPGSTPSAALRRPLRGPALWPPLLHHQSRVV
jgi:hypothetical protein